jgi:phosphoglycerate dehydrogenase-like enzyme
VSLLRQRVRGACLRAAALSASGPRIAVAPFADEGITQAVAEGGGITAGAEGADGVIWTDAGDPGALGRLLESSPARWVQLPFAGIERFVQAGVVTSDRIWTCAKGAYGPATAEHALALMLAAARQIHRYVRLRSWVEPGPGSLERRLADASVLVFGAGGIGRSLIEMLAPLGARLVAVNRSGSPVPGARRTVPMAALDDVIGDADWVVITAPLTDETKGLFDRRLLSKMSPDAWLINVARGGIVDTDALVEALRGGGIAGAALDVTDPEPLPDGHPLWAMDNAIVTPHVANTWDMALPELRALVRKNVAHYAAGEGLDGLVDPSLGY